ncbi:MAG: hypothetical protein ACOC10_09445, partial [Bacteroidota bacterium]
MPTKITYDSLANESELKKLGIDLQNIGNQVKGIKTSLQSISKADAKGFEQLDKAGKKLVATENQIIKTQSQQQAALKQLDKQRQRALQQIAKQEAKERDLIKASKMQVKSIDDLQKKTNALVAIRKRLDLTSKQGQLEYRRLSQEINNNTNKLKQQDAAIGRYQRNVGNYAQGLVGGLKMMIGPLAGISGAIMVSK